MRNDYRNNKQVKWTRAQVSKGFLEVLHCFSRCDDDFIVDQIQQNLADHQKLWISQLLLGLCGHFCAGFADYRACVSWKIRVSTLAPSQRDRRVGVLCLRAESFGFGLCLDSQFCSQTAHHRPWPGLWFPFYQMNLQFPGSPVSSFQISYNGKYLKNCQVSSFLFSKYQRKPKMWKVEKTPSVFTKYSCVVWNDTQTFAVYWDRKVWGEDNANCADWGEGMELESIILFSWLIRNPRREVFSCIVRV